ncbi:DUF11 domain-containing protein [Bosea sp. BK604]|uniref:DUF11 domain-containing protein n=1 Tax=Bosea sp. BK604 TaxID=2512180 RepID=UPI00104A8199|nr:DUF11 domain-containing protein [Bosea sp. BK604]
MVAVDGGGDALIGETTQITVTFTNTPVGPGNNVGYSPYIDVILPTRGADGSASDANPVQTKDGVTFEGATLYGQALQATQLEFGSSGSVTHPFARDASGNLRVVNASDYGAQPGDTLVVMSLPFGSFVPDQPPAPVQISLGVSQLADLNVPLSVSAVGGFAFGRDALNNPTADAPVLSGTANNSITPVLFTVNKTSNLAEGETATGPSFPHQYTVTLDVANGQTMNNLVLNDTLPNGIVVTGASANGATVDIQQANGLIVATFNGPVTGTASAADVTMTIDFHVGQFMSPDSPAEPVLDPVTGAPRVLPNNVSGSADWTPVDSRDDPVSFVEDPAGPENVIVAKALATQKTAANLSGNQTAVPGDVIEWTIRTQVSDYFSLDDLDLSDFLSDGQTFDAGFTPTIFLREQGTDQFSGSFNIANYSVALEGTGTRVIFHVGDEMVSRGLDSVLDGGGGIIPRPTELVIVFRSVVDANFSGGAPVLHDDAIANSVESQAIINNGTGNPITDASSITVPITPGQLDGKSVYAINGNTSIGLSPLVTNGDVVTFRIQYTIPPQSGQDFVLTDFLPLPIFAAGSISFIDQVSSAAPGVGQAWFGPSDTFDAANPTGYAGVPSVIVGALSNSISFRYGNYELASGSGPLRVDILFSVVVQDQPFGDGLVMNNVVQASEINSTGLVTVGVDTADVILSQPELTLQKGIVASTNPDTVFTPSPAAPVVFTDPGSGGTRFSGTISSGLLASSDVVSDVTRVDGGDIVTFAIIVENTGSGRNGAFDILIRDTLAAGFAIPGGAAGLNLRVTDGAGNLLAFTGDIFGAGISLTDQPGTGALAPADPASGRNILVITYDLQLINTVATPNLTIANAASLDHYAAQEGGTDFAPNLLPEDRTASASATTAGPGIIKEVAQTSLPESAGSTLLIGEEVWYDVTVTLAEGTLGNFILTDTLPNTAGGKLSLLDASLLSVGGNISFANGTPVFTQTDSNGDGIVDQVSVNFGNTLNTPDNIVNANDRIVLRVHAVLPDLPENNSGDRLTNTAVASFTDGNGAPQTITATAPITVGAPGPTITKTAIGSTTVDAGDVVEYEVVVSNPVIGGVAAPVFDLLVGDALVDAHLSLVVGSVSASNGAATVLEGNASGDTFVLISLAELGAGQSLTIRYRALVANDVIAGDTLINTAVQRSDSAPGDVADQRVFISSDNETLLVATPALLKQVTDTSLPDTGSSQGNAALPDVAFGETVTFTLTATMPEGVTQAVILLDQLPLGPGAMEVTAASIVLVGGNLVIGSGAGVGTAGILSDRNGDGRLDTVTFNLGDVSNSQDGAVNASDQISFQISARLVSTSGAAPGAVTTNIGQLSFVTPGGPSAANASASIEIVAPTFGIAKTPDVQNVDGGDEITYTVRITNTGGAFSAPGYDLAIADLLDDPSLSLIAGSVTLTGPAGATVTSGNGAGDTAVGIAATRLAQGEVIIVTYRALVDNLVPTATQLLNRVDYTADSYPGNVPGERDFSGSAAAVVDVEGPISVKAITATSLTETGSNAFTPFNPDLAIGERVTYRIAQVIPEGSTTLRIVDSLPTAGTALEFLAFRLVTKGGNITLPQAPVVTQIDTDGDGRIDQVTIDFGTITNIVDNQISADDLLAIEIDARVVDDPRNVAGDVATNTAQIFVNNVLFATRTASADIVEPDFEMFKTASIASGDAGDEVTFTVTGAPSATMTGPAYDLVFVDALAPGLQLIAGSVTASRGTIVEGNGAGDTRIQITGIVLLPTDGVITVTYRARLLDSVEHGQVIQNTATLDYFSAPDVEDRDYSTAASSTLSVVLNPDIHKSVALTDIPETGAAQFDPTVPDVNNGETIVYRITIRLGEGTQSVVLTDAMPAGLTFLQLGAIRFGANISGLVVDNGAPFTVINNVLTFDFGTLTNHGDNLSNAADEITVDVIARAGGTNAAGTQLTNTSTATLASPLLPAVPALVRTSSASVEIVAPDPVITKTASIVSGDAGDEVLYTVVVSQSALATGPLFHATISDLLGPGLVLIPGSVTTTRGTVDFGNGAGNDLVIVSPGRVINVGDAPITITYRARLADSVEPGQILINTANVSGETTFVPNPDSLVFDASDDASLTVDMPVALTKSVVASSIDQTQASQFNPANPDAAVGEVVTYRVAATLSEGTQRVIVSDTLPLGVSIVAVRSSLPGFTPIISISPDGRTITADFGIVVNPGNNILEPFNLGIDIDVLVQDVPGNVAGTVLDNASGVTISSPTAPGVPGGTETASASASIDIVEPELVLSKATNAGFVAPGEAIPWTLTLQHAAGSTSAAFDILITDLLAGTGLDLIAGTVTVNRGLVVSGNNPGDNMISIALGSLALGETLTIGFQTRLSASTPPAAEVVNTANGDFDSAPGLGGRPDDVAAQASLPVAPGITKAVAATDIPQTGNAAFNPALPDLAIGETVTYRIVATLPQTTVNGFAINDLLPAGLEALSASVISVGSALGGSLLQPGDAGTINGQGISFVFGTIVNGGSAAIGAEDMIVVEVVARVRDIAGNAAGSVLVNASDAVFTIGGRSGEQSAFAATDIVEPQLVVIKQADHPTGDAGDPFTYTVTIAHAPASSGPAFDVVLQDILPSVLQGLSVTSSTGTATLSGNTVRLTLPQFLPGDAPIVLTYTVRMTDAIEPGQQVPNLATLSFDSAPAGAGRDGSGQASATVTGVLGVDLAKEIVATSLPQTGAEQFDPNRPDLAIGETITYRLTATLAEGTQRLVILDEMPAGLVPISASLIDIGALIGSTQPLITIAGQAVSLDFGVVVNPGNNVAGDGTVVIEIVARVANAAANQAGRLLENTAAAIIASPSNPGAPGGTAQDMASAAAEVVTPAILVDKTADVPFATIGQQVSYTVVVGHAPGSTAPVFELVIEDLLVPGMMVLTPGSVTSSLGTIVSGNNAGDGTIRIIVPELLLGQSITIRYTVEIVGVPSPNPDLVNTAAASGASVPGDVPPGFVRPVTGGDDAVVTISSGGDYPAGAALDRGLLDEYQITPVRALPVNPIFTGKANPGSTIQLAGLDRSGGLMAVTTTVTDYGGDWIASLPIATASPASEPALDALAQSSLFRDGLDGFVTYGAYRAGAPGSAVSAQPFALEVSYSDPTPVVAPHLVEAPRLSFDGAYIVRTQFKPVPELVSIDLMPAELNSLVWNSFARDFTAALLDRR